MLPLQTMMGRTLAPVPPVTVPGLQGLPGGKELPCGGRHPAGGGKAGYLGGKLQPVRPVGKAGCRCAPSSPSVPPGRPCRGFPPRYVFGLYDTQSLAKELHQLYYEGYHGVSLPHKFKIAVGGCPNNCVKWPFPPGR